MAAVINLKPIICNSRCSFSSLLFIIRYYKRLLLSFCLLVYGFHFTASGQKKIFFTADTVYNAKRVNGVILGSGTIYVASMVGLYNLWYKDSNLTSLHSFNDNAEWLQMDKVGHIGSAYYLGKMGIGMLNWTGLSRKKAIWYGGLMGAVFQTSIELFDGISPLYGFSWGDVAANALGSALLISQELAWDEQRIQFKYSFRPSKYSKINPELLGTSFIENVFKDYNGQTYWLSANISDFLPESNKFPKWLSISVGYGANGLLGGFSNDNFPQYQYPRYRQFYISPDIDLAKIKTKSKLLHTVLYTFGFLKIPMPGIEVRVPGKISFLPLAF